MAGLSVRLGSSLLAALAALAAHRNLSHSHGPPPGLTPPSLLSGREILERLEVEPLLACLPTSEILALSLPVIPPLGVFFFGTSPPQSIISPNLRVGGGGVHLRLIYRVSSWLRWESKSSLDSCSKGAQYSSRHPQIPIPLPTRTLRNTRHPLPTLISSP